MSPPAEANYTDHKADTATHSAQHFIVVHPGRASQQVVHSGHAARMADVRFPSASAAELVDKLASPPHVQMHAHVGTWAGADPARVCQDEETARRIHWILGPYMRGNGGSVGKLGSDEVEHVLQSDAAGDWLDCVDRHLHAADALGRAQDMGRDDTAKYADGMGCGRDCNAAEEDEHTACNMKHHDLHIPALLQSS